MNPFFSTMLKQTCTKEKLDASQFGLHAGLIVFRVFFTRTNLKIHTEIKSYIKLISVYR